MTWRWNSQDIGSHAKWVFPDELNHMPYGLHGHGGFFEAFSVMLDASAGEIDVGQNEKAAADVK